MFVRKYCYGTRGGGFVDMCCFYRKNGWRRKRCAFWIVVWNHNFPCCYIFWWRNIHLSQLVQSQARITATKSMSPTSTLFYFCRIQKPSSCAGMWEGRSLYLRLNHHIPIYLQLPFFLQVSTKTTWFFSATKKRTLTSVWARVFFWGLLLWMLHLCRFPQSGIWYCHHCRRHLCNSVDIFESDGRKLVFGSRPLVDVIIFIS